MVCGSYWTHCHAYSQLLTYTSDPDGKPLLARKDDAITELRLTTSEQGLSFILQSQSANFITVDRE